MSQYSFSLSIKIKFLLRFLADKPVVPLPAKGSKTVPFSGQQVFIQLSTISIGNGAGNLFFVSGDIFQTLLLNFANFLLKNVRDVFVFCIQ